MIKKIYKLWKKRRRKQKYREYLKSDHWLNFRRRILKNRNMCRRCGSRERLQLHHRRYKDDRGRSVLGRERSRDVEVLCRGCHNLVHRKN